MAASLGLAACGADDGEGESSIQGVGQARAGSVAALAQCRDWSEGTVQKRFAAVADVREQLTASGAAADSPRISDEEAYELFESACSNEFAQGFRLYKIYARAAAFQSLADEP